MTQDRLETIAAEYTPARARWAILVGDESLEGPRDETPEGPERTRDSPHAAKRVVIGLRYVSDASCRVPSQPLVAWKYRIVPQAGGAVGDESSTRTDDTEDAPSATPTIGVEP